MPNKNLYKVVLTYRNNLLFKNLLRYFDISTSEIQPLGRNIMTTLMIIVLLFWYFDRVFIFLADRKYLQVT